jgi:hypothetical protein
MCVLKKNICRRTFLKGSGGALMLLPFLEANANQKENSVPKRIVATGIFFGLMPHLFFPDKTGSEYKTPELLKPLEKHRQDFTVINGLDHNLTGAHEATKYFLSGIPIQQMGNFKEANISVDQKAALHTGSATRYSSLCLGCETNSENFISWNHNGSQVRPINSLNEIYSLLFHSSDPKAKKTIELNMVSRESVLDLVRDQAKSYSKNLGKVDREKLDQYFTSIREL